MTDHKIAWTADEATAASTNIRRFMDVHQIGSITELHTRSIDDPEWFWPAVIEFLGIPFQKPWRTVMDTSRGLPWTTWFNGSEFNMSVACVDRWAEETPDAIAVKAMKETGEVTEVTFAGLLQLVEKASGAMAALGVDRRDPVGVFLPMGLEAVVSLLAIARLGAVFIPIFSGYGAEAVATRLTDPKPKLLVCANAYVRKGKVIEMKEVADAAIESAGGIESVLVVDYAPDEDTPWTEGRDVFWSQALADAAPAGPAVTGAEDPVLLAYTSGTTGRPKGAVHVQAGLTVKIAQEGAFQANIQPRETLMWMTDMGWIMGPWMVIAGLANGAAIGTYDGAPNYPDPGRVWEVAERLGVNFFGISPTLIRSLQPHGVEPARRHDLSALKAFGSTGEPWNPDPWWWLFEEVGEGTRPIINLSGGTEIGACLLSVNLLQGLKPTALGSPSLGIDAVVLNESGEPVVGEVGELAVRGPWPGMTRGFWGEPERYLETYWSRFDDVWVHGDWASIDEDGFWFLHGRSDDTLNIAGKRIGPAEIESAAVASPLVVMAAAIGVPDEVKGEAVVVYVVPAPGVEVGDRRATEIADLVGSTLGRSFKPKQVIWVDDLPRTRSAKIMRRVVKALALGKEPGDTSSLENPESLEGIRALG